MELNFLSCFAAFCGLKKLKSMDLSYNSIEGGVDPCLGGITSLARLYLSNNQFKGNIPSTIFSNLTSIEEIDISNNKFDGALSFSMFANLSKLSFLDLSNNYQLEVETESPTWAPSFQLYSLYLSNCNLNRQSGSAIPTFLSAQYTLQVLDLSHNLLMQAIPSWLLYNASSYLRLRNNTLGGPFRWPLHNLTSPLLELDVSVNHVHGILPQDMGIYFPNLRRLNMSANALQGSIPSSFGEKKIDLQILDLSSNNFTGEIAHGLTRNSTKLIYLNLSNNKLQGEMLRNDSNLVMLRFLRLNSNLFMGTVPPSLSNSPNLILLDIRNNYLSGDITSWLPVLADLGALLLGGNHFQGSVPRQLCQMQNLQFLDLSNNYLFGDVPSCLNNITFWTKESQILSNSGSRTNFQQTNGLRVDFITKGRLYTYEGAPRSLMIGIDVSSNQLTGNIPMEMGDLRVLRSLNLSNNLLMGTIPITFQNLDNLESLDLSHNKLSGKIPREMTQLPSLSTFSVAFNNLSGEIPSDQQFSTFDERSYVGNEGLCGPPLGRNCSSNNPGVGDDEEEEEGEESSRIIDQTLFFYLYVAASFALGFWGWIAFLSFHRGWRQRFFGTVDRYVRCPRCAL